MNDAQKWLAAMGNSPGPAPGYPTAIPFPDGSEVQWNGANWFVAFTERVTIEKDAPLPHCSFCTKTVNDVKLLIAAPAVYICDECVTTCCEILEHKGHDFGWVPVIKEWPDNRGTVKFEKVNTNV